MALSIPELAQRLGVSAARARAIVAHGAIRAERVGGRWVIDESEAALYQPRLGRALSRQNAWRLVEFAVGRSIQDAHPMEKARLRAHLESLQRSSEPAAKLSSLLAKRADRAEFSASPADLGELRQDPRIRLSGVSHPDSGLLSNSEVEAYVSRGDFDALIKDWFLVKAGAGQRPNVVLHVAEEVPEELPPLLVAADLAERPGVREQEAAREIIRSLNAD